MSCGQCGRWIDDKDGVGTCKATNNRRSEYHMCDCDKEVPRLARMNWLPTSKEPCDGIKVLLRRKNAEGFYEYFLGLKYMSAVTAPKPPMNVLHVDYAEMQPMNGFTVQFSAYDEYVILD